MKIANADLSLQSRHATSARQETRESLRVWVGPPRPAVLSAPSVQISDTGKARQSAEAEAIKEAAEAVDKDPMLLMIRRMIEALTGQSVRVFDAAKIQNDAPASETAAPAPSPAAPAPRPADFALEYEYHAISEEAETSQFAAQGTIQTADGRQIDFQLDLTMSRQYREETHVSISIDNRPPPPPPSNRKDPLVINFDGKAAQLTDQRFRFDLDNDGSQENLAMLAAGSGYLALDKNNNGTIDAGNELFGPATGHGFAELAQYDQDGNAWIDENDAVFAQLKVWTPTQDGGTLATLRDRQVGALFLGNVATPFELRGAGNSDLGAVRASSIYLTESGRAGTLQEIDLSV